MPGNVLVAQSGGPSPVINNSLRGVIEACGEHGAPFGTVYAARHGIEGVLKEELLDLSAQPAEEVALLRTTPAAGAIGTCRYKLKESQTEDYDRILEVFAAHDIKYFFYIGGNDSMDTADRVARLAKTRGQELTAVGIPKTIDNDLGLIDHTPGYGSVARYWMNVTAAAEEENRGSAPADPVLVLQAMGRRIGFIPAAARLADPERVTPLQIYMPESGLTLEAMADLVSDELRRSGRCIVVVSEGFDVGDTGESRDSFGHVRFSSGKVATGQAVTNFLNDHGITARWQAPGTDQRSSMVLASAVDLEEAYRVAEKAVEIAASGESGWMATIRRREGRIYGVEYDKVPLAEVANSERAFPPEWIAPSRVDVTDDFLTYARPLVGEDWVSVPLVDGRPRYARLRPVFAEKKCRPYTPQAYR